MKLIAFSGFMIVLFFGINGFTIIRNQGVIMCNGYQCPEETYKCIAMEKTTEDLQNVRIITQCLAANGTLLRGEDKISPNRFPGSVVNNYAESSGSSSVIQSYGNSNLTEEEVKKEQEKWAEWSEKFQANLFNQLKPVFNLPNSLNIPNPAISYNYENNPAVTSRFQNENNPFYYRNQPAPPVINPIALRPELTAEYWRNWNINFQRNLQNQLNNDFYG